MTDGVPVRPLGRKAYGSIAHLPGSRTGPGDRHCHAGQARIATGAVRDRHDHVVVQEKLDGSCVAVARLDGRLHALTRSGNPASGSRFEQHRLFAAWVREHDVRFRALLADGERVVGEWLALAHGTRYALPHEPFVAFDLMTDGVRVNHGELTARTEEVELTTPLVLSVGPPRSIDEVRDAIATSGHGALDPVEGAVWRVERHGQVDFLAKWVRPTRSTAATSPSSPAASRSGCGVRRGMHEVPRDPLARADGWPPGHVGDLYGSRPVPR